MTAAELYDVVTTALHRTRWQWRRPLRFHRYALWLTGPVVEMRTTVGGRPGLIMSWEARAHDERGYGFTRRQVGQMRYRLITAMQTESAQLEARILARIADLGPY